MLDLSKYSKEELSKLMEGVELELKGRIPSKILRRVPIEVFNEIGEIYSELERFDDSREPNRIVFRTEVEVVIGVGCDFNLLLDGDAIYYEEEEFDLEGGLDKNIEFKKRMDELMARPRERANLLGGLIRQAAAFTKPDLDEMRMLDLLISGEWEREAEL